MSLITTVGESVRPTAEAEAQNEPTPQTGWEAFAQIVDASLSDIEIIYIIGQCKQRFPTPVILVRFEQATFTNQRLIDVFSLGIDGYIIGRPSLQLVKQICDRIHGFVYRDSKKFGQLRLQGNLFYRGASKIQLTVKELLLLKILLEARGVPVEMKKLFHIFGYAPTVDSHAVAALIYRLREKLERLGLVGAIPAGKKALGYRLVLD